MPLPDSVPADRRGCGRGNCNRGGLRLKSHGRMRAAGGDPAEVRPDTNTTLTGADRGGRVTATAVAAPWVRIDREHLAAERR